MAVIKAVQRFGQRLVDSVTGRAFLGQEDHLAHTRTGLRWLLCCAPVGDSHVPPSCKKLRLPNSYVVYIFWITLVIAVF